MLRKVVVEVEQSDPDLYEVVNSVPLPELKCGDTGHAYVVLKLVEGNAVEPAAFSCELKFQVGGAGWLLASWLAGSFVACLASSRETFQEGCVASCVFTFPRFHKAAVACHVFVFFGGR